jgi:flagellar motor protein MotB
VPGNVGYTPAASRTPASPYGQAGPHASQVPGAAPYGQAAPYAPAAPPFAPAAPYAQSPPASPFGSVDAGPPRAGLATDTGFETVSIARGELKRLRSSRLKAWLSALGALGALGGGGYLGWQHKGELDAQLRQLRSERGEVERLTALAKREAEAKHAAAAAAEQRLATLGPVAEQAIKRATEAQALARRDQEIVRVLEAALGKEPIRLGSKDGRLSLTLAEPTLFTAGRSEIAHNGMRMLYVMGRALKDIPGLAERRTTVVVTSVASPPARPTRAKGQAKAPPVTPPDDWGLAAARGVALARFLVEDAGLPSQTVAVSVAAPERPGKKGKGKGPTLEIRFELPELPDGTPEAPSR